ncbi:hypothetical protein FXV91_11615 [Methanosarcina sp. DH2]|uniref:hypothetical protein n=1 Tax=Methanosarcina sp. DH2 TaxID=2605639 RepID=UPI001E3D2501|nr:hypothetical protein [Methanosarcina sp. DH2]MCC4770806.1 hypothetical protein [Methanosarcina sp. DH2]
MSRKPVKLLIVFLILVLLSGYALADSLHLPDQNEIIEETTGWSEIPVYDVPYYAWQDNPEETISLLSKLNEESFKNCTNPESPIYDPNVLKAYGSVPAVKNASQLAEFSSTLQTVRDSSIREVKPYLYPDGPIVNYGAGPMPGYFLIKLYDYKGNKTVYSEAELKEIYNIVEKNAIKAGLDEVPVIFCLWDKTAIFYFSENKATFGRDVVQLTDITLPKLFYYMSNSSSLQIIKDGSLNEIQPYLYPEGPIVAYGSDTMDDVFLISLYYQENETVYPQSELDEICNIVKEYADKAGLSGVSVMFYNQEGTVRFDNYYNESYLLPSGPASGSNGGIENSTLNNSAELDDTENITFPIEGTIFPIDDIHHVAAIGLCATLLVIFGIIIVKN